MGLVHCRRSATRILNNVLGPLTGERSGMDPEPDRHRKLTLNLNP